MKKLALAITLSLVAQAALAADESGSTWVCLGERQQKGVALRLTLNDNGEATIETKGVVNDKKWEGYFDGYDADNSFDIESVDDKSIVVTASSHGYDHIDDVLTLDTTTGKLVIKGTYEYDCGDGEHRHTDHFQCVEN